MIPTGWNSIDEDKAYPRLSSRMPELHQTRESSLDSHEDGPTSSESDEDSTFGRDDDGLSKQTRMNDESSEEDELQGPTVSRVSLKVLRDRNSLSQFLSYERRFLQSLLGVSADRGLGSPSSSSSTRIWG